LPPHLVAQSPGDGQTCLVRVFAPVGQRIRVRFSIGSATFAPPSAALRRRGNAWIVTEPRVVAALS
jgi:hypothetical protein